MGLYVMIDSRIHILDNFNSDGERKLADQDSRPDHAELEIKIDMAREYRKELDERKVQAREAIQTSDHADDLQTQRIHELERRVNHLKGKGRG